MSSSSMIAGSVMVRRGQAVGRCLLMFADWSISVDS